MKGVVDDESGDAEEDVGEEDWQINSTFSWIKLVNIPNDRLYLRRNKLCSIYKAH